MENKYLSRSGFTLIELSIVLVIIGLLVGGILTGRDLMDAAAQRAQIAQITKYNTAVNTFRGKYGYLPGDVPNPAASNFGFQTRGNAFWQGNGDGLIAGYADTGEPPMFWEDLSQAGLIDGTFNTAQCCSFPPTVTGTALNSYLPSAKIGNGNYVYAYAGSYNNGTDIYDGFNYYGISAITSLDPHIESNPGLTVQQAYNIDKKIDDGLPQSGNVQAVYLNYDLVWSSHAWAAGGGTQGANAGDLPESPTTTATTGTSTTCYDNGNTNGATQKYSLSQNSGNGLNCALSFKFQ